MPISSNATTRFHCRQSKWQMQTLKCHQSVTTLAGEFHFRSRRGSDSIAVLPNAASRRKLGEDGSIGHAGGRAPNAPPGLPTVKPGGMHPQISQIEEASRANHSNINTLSPIRAHLCHLRILRRALRGDVDAASGLSLCSATR